MMLKSSPDICGAVPLPAGAGAPDAVRFTEHSLPPKKDAAPPAGPSAVTLTRVNRVFTLDEHFIPKSSLFSWIGSARLAIDGDFFELPIGRR